MEKRWCSACGDAFEPRPQSPRQAYCPKKTCQQARKQLWQRTKRRTDYDYRQNQCEAQEAWRRSHPDYWQKYRAAHPDYTTSNRNRQKERNSRRFAGDAAIAKGDASSLHLPATGLFRLIQLQPDDIGSRREWTVQLTLLAQG